MSWVVLAEDFAEDAAHFADGAIGSDGGEDRRHEVLGRVEGGLAQGCERAGDGAGVAG